MTEEIPPSAFAAMRALRDEMRARLDRNEDYRAWKALDDALRELDPPRLPAVRDFVVETSRTDSTVADSRDPAEREPPVRPRMGFPESNQVRGR